MRFARLDVKGRAGGGAQDDAVDSEFRSILRQLITFMMEVPAHDQPLLECCSSPRRWNAFGTTPRNMAEYDEMVYYGRVVATCGTCVPTRSRGRRTSSERGSPRTLGSKRARKRLEARREEGHPPRVPGCAQDSSSAT